MSGLVEQAQWENEVYQIEQTDPVVGGPPDLAAQEGFTNVPHLHLANRTLWLKAQLEALQTALDDFDVSGDVQTAIDAVLDGAPGALDTLNELAAALGDDPNFAATITAQIATKLSTASYTAADVLAKIKTVDGPGSGLNADYLDGISSASFVQTSRSISTGTGLTGGGNLGANRTISANIATQAEAEAGTSSTKLMTSQRTAQAIAEQVPDLTGWAFSARQSPAGGETAIDFTGIPSGVNEIAVYIENTDTTAGRHRLQFGTSAGVVSTGYVTGSGAYFGNATGGGGIYTGVPGWNFHTYYTARNLLSTTRWIRQSGDKWSGGGPFASSSGMGDLTGAVDLAGELTRVRVTLDGAGSFVAGGQIIVGWRK